MERDKEHQSYGPGKFEGEGCYTRIGYYWYLNGEGDDDGDIIYFGPFTKEDIAIAEQDTTERICQPCYDALLLAKGLTLFMDTTGFVYGTLLEQ